MLVEPLLKLIEVCSLVISKRFYFDIFGHFTLAPSPVDFGGAYSTEKKLLTSPFAF